MKKSTQIVSEIVKAEYVRIIDNISNNPEINGSSANYEYAIAELVRCLSQELSATIWCNHPANRG